MGALVITVVVVEVYGGVNNVDAVVTEIVVKVIICLDG